MIEEVIELLLAASTCNSLVLATLSLYGEPEERTKEEETVIGLAFDAVALLREQDDFEEDETDEDYYLEAMLEAAQRLIDGRLALP